MYKFFIVFWAILLMVLLFVSSANAAEFGIAEKSGQVTLDEQKVIHDNYIAVGSQIKLDGKIKGDLIIFAGTVEVNGPVEGNLIIAAGQVKVSSEVAKNLYIGAGQVELTDKSHVKGDVFIGSGTVLAKGQIQGKLYAGCANLVIDGKIDKGFVVNSGKITLESNAKIDGDIKYTANEEMIIKGGAVTKGQISKKIIDQTKEAQKKKGIGNFANQATGKFLSLISTLVVGIILLLLFPQFTDKVSNTLKEKLWPSLGWGLLVLIVVPIVMLISTLLLVGFPLAMILFGLYWLFIYLAKIFVGLCLGKYISKEKWNPIWSMSLGVLILIIISLIPIIGGLANLVILLVGLGSAVITVKQIAKTNK